MKKGILMTGRAVPELAGLDDAVIAWMAEKNVPGASLAVARNNRLVLARGYGWGDLQSLAPAQPGSLFRIASITKPITSAAIMRLVQDGRLSLSDRVFDLLKVEPYLEPGAEFDERLRAVTVLQCLNHTGGWDRSKSGDPMAKSVAIAQALHVQPPAEPEHIIRWMAGRRLEADPGKAYAYSNFGYCILGRIIESLSGVSYERYVKEQILDPLGVRRMQIGRTLPKFRADGEVAYYPANDLAPSVFADSLGCRIPKPYGSFYLEAMDSHGAWIASAPELVRFGSAFNDPDNCPILHRRGVEAMFERPPAPVWHDAAGNPQPSFYANGWMVDLPHETRIERHNHSGMLDGTTTTLLRRGDGVCWALLFNSSPPGTALERLDKAVSEVKQWPGDALEWGEYL
ncbi:MAG TPA: serine hydrolase domain-containing protein [Candidatus Brocadiia bacterium]|nr:serine hydrolase domain-containing protein [Candidatus Brocadiia bacterium]